MAIQLVTSNGRAVSKRPRPQAPPPDTVVEAFIKTLGELEKFRPDHVDAIADMVAQRIGAHLLADWREQHQGMGRKRPGKPPKMQRIAADLDFLLSMEPDGADGIARLAADLARAATYTRDGGN